MKAILPSWIDSMIIEGLDHIDGCVIVNRTNPEDFTLYSRLIIILLESRATHPEVYAFIEANANKYHMIFTFDRRLLETCKNTKLLLFGTTWISRENALSPPHSKSGISFLCGSKMRIIGQRIRRIIYNNQPVLQKASGRELVFWRSGKDTIIPQVSPFGNPILGTNADAKFLVHGNRHFSIITENNQQENYFTEKIIDCFLCKTVPIYWGCPNIGSFFSLDGIIILTGNTETEILDNLVKILRGCTEQTYNSMLAAIEYNYTEAFKYAYNYNDRIKELIHESI
jgi:hypothetical protein